MAKGSNNSNDAKSAVFFTNLGGQLEGVANLGAIKYAWRAPTKSYDNIAGDLGVTKAQDTESGLVFGCNIPRPVRIRINYSKGNGVSGSCVRWCDPSKLEAVTTGRKLNGKKVNVNGKEYNINSASPVGIEG